MSIFLRAEWRKLIMAQYEVDPATLAPYLPVGTKLDFYPAAGQQRCYVSLVGFLFDRVRVKGWAIPFHTRFEEINLRFYVRRIEPDGSLRRGVVFIREFVPRHAITFVASTFYDEPYATIPTRHRIEEAPQRLFIEYAWKYRVAGESLWYSLDVEASPLAQPIAEGSEEEFLTEHYWGYTKRRDGTTSQYEVKHPPWQVYPILSCNIQADFNALYGPAFRSLNGIAPASILLAEGSEVSVDTGTQLHGSGLN